MDNYKQSDKIYQPVQEKEYAQIQDAHEELTIKKSDITFNKTYDIPRGGGIIATPLITKDRIYVGACDYHMYCLDKDGSMIWKFRTGGVLYSSPTIFKDRIYFGSHDGHVYCLGKDGNLVWKFQTGNMIPSSPVIMEGLLYIGSGDGNLYCLDPDTGKKTWSFTTGDAITNTPSFANDMIFFGSFDSYFYCIDMSGNLVWKKISGDANGATHSPVISDEKLNLVWDFTMRHQPKMPKLQEGLIFYGSRDHRIYCRSLEGDMKWEFLTGGMAGNHITLADRNIYSGCFDSTVYCLNAIDGRKKWSFMTGGIIISSPAVKDGAVFVTSYEPNMHVLNASTGSLIWTFATGGGNSNPCIDRDILYVGSLDTHLYCIDIKKRTVNWTFQAGFGETDVGGIVNKLVEYDRKVFRIWKPDKMPLSAQVKDVQYKLPSNVPDGMTYGGEQTYASSATGYTSGVSYNAARKKRDMPF